jgi:hypothetical protein
VRRLTSPILAGLLSSALLTPLLVAAPATAAPARQIVYTQWDSADELRIGTMTKARVGNGGRISLPPGARAGTWTSPWAKAGFSLTRLVASWDARTPGASRVRIDVRGRTPGTTSSWDTLGVWAESDRFFKRTTRGAQTDDLGSVSTDTWVVPGGVSEFQLRVTLARRAGQRSPWVDAIGAMASRLPDVSSVATSKPGVARGVVLDVPTYSQMIHRGHYPEYGAGGEAWCSPTSTAMVLGYYDALPAASSYSWIPKGHPDPWVDHVARMTYDYAYDGTGNWPFNTAYAATRVDRAFVTRLRSLREAEVLVKAGIPVVASIAFDRGGLTGAPISSTDGHLLVIVGFTDSGDVVVNDPAGATDDAVRRTYDRGEFENAWLPTSGGTVYVIADDAHPLPVSPRGNW